VVMVMELMECPVRAMPPNGGVAAWAIAP
jgi:hypothetical protein